MIQQIYSLIEPYLAVVGFSVLSLGGIFAAALGAVKLVGEKWISSKFNERLENFKYAQQREIEQLKFEINASMDRAVKLHQREFDTVPEAWSSLVTSIKAIQAFTSAFQSYPDLARMSELELKEFFSKSEITEHEKEEIRRSGDKNKKYQETIFWYDLHKCRSLHREHHVYLLKNAIFMLPTMKAKFTAIGDLAWDALTEHQIRHEYNDWKERSKREKFEKDGDALLSELEADIQKRLWDGVKVV